MPVARPSSPRVFVLLVPLVSLVASCTSDLPAADDTDELGDESAESDGSEAPDTGEDDSDTGVPADTDSCSYTSPFTQGAECRDYVGAGWTEADIQSNCDSVSGEVSFGKACSTTDVLGRCILDDGTDYEYQIVVYGTDPDACELQELGCENFGGGVWQPSATCGGGGGGGDTGKVFIQPYLDCRDPLPDEPPGQSEGGKVCTWQAISASTEEGRKFVDYGDCDVVYSQRPYYNAPPNTPPAEPDPRLEDPQYAEELEWVRDQIESSACICCHSNQIAPDGPANWYVEAPNNWVNSFYDSGLALGAGWIDSTSFGAYPPEQNNGFDRIHSGIPSTDPERMVAFFQNELLHRGRTEEDFANSSPFGGPLYEQMIYEPQACENGEGVQLDGTIVWAGGTARYVYVLEAGSGNPTVPPNLDLPDGTLWRIDVPSGGEPITSGEVSYGQTPAGLAQRFPIDGAPNELVPGGEYYLYVTKDVGIPITRCLFTYGG